MKIWMVTGGDEEGTQYYVLCLTEKKADEQLKKLEAEKEREKKRIWYYKHEEDVLE